MLEAKNQQQVSPTLSNETPTPSKIRRQRVKQQILNILLCLPIITAQSPSCPCITAPTWGGLDICPRDRFNQSQVLVKYGESMTCFNGSYGIGSCKAWDGMFEPECVNDPAPSLTRPSYCDEPWCYVDKEACSNSTHLAQVTDILVVTGPNPPTYSYTACGGDPGQWQDEKVMKGLIGKTLRAGISKIVFPEHYLTHLVTGEQMRSGKIPVDMSDWVWTGLWIEYFEYVGKVSERASRVEKTRDKILN